MVSWEEGQAQSELEKRRQKMMKLWNADGTPAIVAVPERDDFWRRFDIVFYTVSGLLFFFICVEFFRWLHGVQ
jgi:hypothetical protein